MSSYPFEDVEGRWQGNWENAGVDRVEDEAPRPFYVLEMFPYPSGDIHMGHVRNYTIGDAQARYHRTRGRDVLHPMGWDAYWMPAENAAFERVVHPDEWTDQNIANMKDQLQRLGLSYDWDREIKTADPEYYRWNQRIFLEFYRRDLAYRDRTEVNWCPSCETVLANEQVHDGSCWRCDTEVVVQDRPGWFLRITEYADQLLEDMDQLEGWPDEVLRQQRNWIGRSHGARIRFPVVDEEAELPVFTTRPDTLHGATFMVLSPDHPEVEVLVRDTGYEDDVMGFLDRIRGGEEAGTTDGVFTGRYVRNPVNDEEIPIYVADYVLMEYGTGAIMAVPAHDERDFEFARHHGIEVRPVIQPEDDTLEDPLEAAYIGEGKLINSGPHTGLASSEARREIPAWLEEHDRGKPTVNYRLRDWGISRQRYWGTPIPIVHCEDCGVVEVPEDQLPVTLPRDVEFSVSADVLSEQEDFVRTACPECGGEARRETDTMDTFVDSSWYYARFLSPEDDGRPFDPERAERWLPVDLYVGGIEHACMHLLYARFFHKAMRDFGWVEDDEPFARLLTQGMVLKDGEKMSKSVGNVVDPETMLERYGADTVRMFTLFAAPPEKDLEWDESGVNGAFRFLNRLWSFHESHGEDLSRRAPDFEEPDPAGLTDAEETLHRETHRTIRDVPDDIEEDYQLNTAIAACMELHNVLGDADPETNDVVPWSFAVLLNLLSPVAPHLCCEIGERLGMDPLPLERSWPDWSEEAARADEVEIAVQVNGTVRDRMTVPLDCDEEVLRRRARERPRIQEWTNGEEPERIIVVPNKLVNIVV